MKTLTQQQINQYQWRAADGVAVPVNPIPYNVLDENWVNKASELLPIIYHTNAPDGIYSGEAFESGWWKQNRENEDDGYFSRSNFGFIGYDYMPYLKLKPSHLPAVLTTQPGEEWKDRYTCFIKQGNVEKECRTTNATFLKDKSLLWRLNDVTPPAEQEAETFKNGNEELAFERFADELNSNLNNIAATIVTDATWPELISRGGRFEINTCVEIACNNLLQSTLTPKDQRIAELERMLDQCQKNDLYFEQEKEQLNNRIAELEREREWVSVHEFDESTLPIVGKSVIGIVDYMRCGIDKRDYIVCYMGEEKETRLLADDDYYGWDFDECIAQWVYLDMPLKPIF